MNASIRKGLLSNASNPLFSSTTAAPSANRTPETASQTMDHIALPVGVPVYTIGCPQETYPGEARVAVSPDSVKLLSQKGFTVLIEKGAGEAAHFSDDDYRAIGAKIVTREEAWAADVILKVRSPTVEEIPQLRDGAAVYSFVYPAQNSSLLEKLAEERTVTLFAMDCVPRITRAQVFDALSSMANIAGYKAVVEAAHHFGRFLSGQMTAAGRVPPAKVLVIGGGVAGLSAIATAKSLGAIVRCFDTRPAVKDQVASLGGEFLEIKGVKLEEGTGGYAKEMTKEFIDAEMALFAAQAKEVDIIITTALIPGRPAPKLITAKMISTMKHGSVVVDLAAEAGGNIETTVKGEVYVSDNGVTHIGLTDLPSRLPSQSSRLYANNIAKLFLSMVPKGTQALTVDMEDDVIRGCCILDRGRLVWPPAKPVTGPPPPTTTARPRVMSAAEVADIRRSPLQKSLSKAFGVTIAVLALCGVNLLTAESAFLHMLSIFCLAGAAGYQAVWGVTPALHTPLMSVTNAVSGIVAVGGLMAVGHGGFALQAIAYAAILAAFINISGGFLITHRMLKMFRRPGDPSHHTWTMLLPGVVLLGLFFGAQMLGWNNVMPSCYLLCSMFCILSIAGLSTQKSAPFGNAYGILGVICGVAVTLASVTYGPMVKPVLTAVIVTGTLIGLGIGRAVQVTDLPQTVAGFHSCVGLAAMLTSVAHWAETANADGSSDPSTAIAAILGNLVGGITLTGSIVAFGKLHGIMGSKPLSLPGKNALNLLACMVQLWLICAFMSPTTFYLPAGSFFIRMVLMIATSVLACLLGWHLVASVGGGDMPVCITVLNSYSGWALVAEGFMLRNSLLTIVGSLIGFSGGILSYIMCVAMNRSLANVLFGGYSQVAPKKGSGDSDSSPKEHRETSVEEVADLISSAKSVIVVPGYGMAVARAQYALAEVAKKCQENNVKLRFAIHPVAGRMPGQMNVLLAEAGVPYDWVFEMEEINEEFGEADVALVVGANDITNSAAQEDPTCAIAGMPVLEVWNARHCVFMKRSMGSGYADLENPVFYKPNTLMLLGDARNKVEALSAALTKIFD